MFHFSRKKALGLHDNRTNETKTDVSLISYNEQEIYKKKSISFKETVECREAPYINWIQVKGITNVEAIAAIGKQFSIHPLVIEDILHRNQRPKLDVYQNQVFIIAHLLHYDEKNLTMSEEQVSLIFGTGFLISVVEESANIFHAIEENLEESKNRIRSQGADYLAYSILDTVVDSYFNVLEKVSLFLDDLEEKLNDPHHPRMIQKIQHAKHNLIILRRSIWPMRDVINRFLHAENFAVSSTTQIYLRDVYDHTIQGIDLIEGFRDIVSSMMDISLSNINIKTNDIIKVLTIVSTIFVPLTFITSIYGMNIEHMPELHFRWFYPFLLFIMVCIACGMLLFFRRKQWI